MAARDRAGGPLPPRGAVRRVRGEPPRRPWRGLERAHRARRPAEYAAVCASQPHPQALRALGRLGVGAEQLEAHQLRGGDRQPRGGLGRRGAGARPGSGRAAAGTCCALGYGGGEAIAQAIEVTGAPPADRRGRPASPGEAIDLVHVLPLDPRPPGRTALGRARCASASSGSARPPTRSSTRSRCATWRWRPGARRWPTPGVEPVGHPGALRRQRRLGRLQLRELDRPDGRPTTWAWCPRPARCASRRPAAPAPGPCTWAAWRSCRASTTP